MKGYTPFVPYLGRGQSGSFEKTMKVKLDSGNR